jgi:bacteriocin-like protein
MAEEKGNTIGREKKNITPAGNVNEFLQKEPDELSDEELTKVSGGMPPKGTLDPTETSGCCG